jgi:RimJ/RimL family protein N-acetyltransferase
MKAKHDNRSATENLSAFTKMYSERRSDARIKALAKALSTIDRAEPGSTRGERLDMERPLSEWQGVELPARRLLEGRYTRLEPIDIEQHGLSLFEASIAPGAEQRFRYLFDEPPADRKAMTRWLTWARDSGDPLFFAVVDRQSGRAEGRQSLMRIDSKHGVVEIGHILWGPAIAKTRVATEALFLTAAYVFDRLGYRRFEWKCDNNNEPSKRAALRFGFTFEGVFRQHMVLKGRNRDTAWFAITDSDWPILKKGYEDWLNPKNFDDGARERSKLASYFSCAQDVLARGPERV